MHRFLLFLKESLRSGAPVFLFLFFMISPDFYAQSSAYDLYVSSQNTNSVKLYDGQTGAYIKDFVAPGSGGLDETQEVVFGSDGCLYVTGFRNTTIKKYNGQTGAFIGNFSTGYSLSNPAKMTFNYADNLIYVSQWGGSRKVARFRMSDGVFVDEFTSVGLAGNCGFGWDSNGNLYVAGWGTNGMDGHVQKFGTDGASMGPFISAPTVQGPVNCWFGANDTLFVQDWSTGNIELFDSSGTFIRTYISNLVRTEGYDWDENGHLYLCDWFLDRIHQYDAQGNFIGIFASGGGLDTPNGLVFGPKYQPVSIEANSEALPKAYFLKQNYPNPFNPSTTIAFNLPEAAQVTIELFDILGNKIKTLLNQQKIAGSHSVHLGARNLAGGVYLYRIQANDFVDVKKMVLLK